MRAVALALLLAALLVVPAQAADPVIVAAGDAVCSPGSTAYNGGAGTFPPAETPGRCHQRYTADRIEALAPLHLLALGDLQYDDGALAKFQDSYEASWGRPAIKAKTKPVPGNHEYGAGNSNNGNIRVDANATGYFTYFQAQLAAEGPDAGDPKKGWYSFDIAVGGAKWHIVALNSECAAGLADEVGWVGGCDAGSEQERWLRADLAADTSDCTLAYWHHPLFSSDGSVGYPLTKPLWQALHDDYADIVLAGHRHNYERFAQQDPNGLPAPGRGVKSWIVGNGGHSLHAFGAAELPTTEARYDDGYGVLKLTLHGPAAGHPKGWYEWQFAGDGQSGPTTFTDSGSADCVEPPDPPAPPPPAPVAAAAVPPALADRVAPLLSRARLSRRRFRVGRGTLIGFNLSEAATATFRVDRRRRGRYRRAGSFRRRAAKGRRRVRFRGRIGRKRLRPGVYRLTITLTDSAGNVGRPRRLLFRILK